jgi:hypothetical protein
LKCSSWESEVSTVREKEIKWSESRHKKGAEKNPWSLCSCMRERREREWKIFVVNRGRPSF